jgi:hypothetical protein
MRIEGKCHCGNISYVFDWPGDQSQIPVRSCGCTFCVKHGGTYTSHRDATLESVIRDEASVSKYRFGTGTADFFVCSRCGALPFVTSEIQGRIFAVVNVNTFEGVDHSILKRSAANFDGEDTESRLDRRRRTWIPDVSIKISRA